MSEERTNKTYVQDEDGKLVDAEIVIAEKKKPQTTKKLPKE